MVIFPQFHCRVCSVNSTEFNELKSKELEIVHFVLTKTYVIIKGDDICLLK